MYFYLFIIFSNLALFFGLVLVFFQNPMYSILSLVGCIFFSVMVLFMYGIEFMSFVYLVVYIGAIAILFLFIIMMLNISALNSVPNDSSTISFFLYFLISFKSAHFFFLVNQNLFLFYLDDLQRPFFLLDFSMRAPFYKVNSGGKHPNFFFDPSFLEIQKSFTDHLADLVISGLGSTSELASFCILYNVYFLYLILSGFILLFAMLGSISLCIVK